ncbi:fluoride efflux transporter CrcB [Aquiflexum sp. TKW24L]|uniref:fluoride efflux transporter CrcB n=1 Tax=Aquiflexum sp. TKW24L TaxID=2942212 RepID=UPI0020BEE91B|nr:fluoride efflux transporter CrcB [Aquiflexum sp. TKW24L]MCL6260523.1 fluoride efflux transporter CrcB [Aquiflexum sp. TKW24L]
MKQIILVGIGGGIGSIFRYLIKVWTARFSEEIPLATFSANIIGCLLIGLLMGYFTKNEHIPSDWSLLLITGFCGGFTTFSTFSSENLNLLQTGNYVTALTYILGSVVIGILAVFLGYVITR